LIRLTSALPPARALLALLAAALCLTAPPADANRIFVPRQHRTIQGAIDAASPGDTLWVAAGHYKGPIRITKNLVVFGDGGPDSTIIDGGDSVRVVHVEGVRGGRILGFTIRRGKSEGGAGVYCLHDSSFSISSCIIEKNWPSGIAAWQCPGLAIVDNVIRQNQESGVSLNFSDAYLRGDHFVENVAPEGGALAMVHSNLVGQALDCLFERNRATAGTGGAIFADSSTFAVYRCTFTGNKASVAGGAISAMDKSHGLIGGSVFRENHANSGGALHSDESTVNVGFCIFNQNSCNAAAAAIQVLRRGSADINPILSNNTFYLNSSAGEGAAILCQDVSPEIRKNIFVVAGFVKAVLGFNSSPLYECNLIYDPTGAEIGSLPSKDTLVGDPRFCDPKQGDFRVRDLSPAYLAPCGPVGAEVNPCPTFKVLPSN
jgi:predicted outer membrane repeat protein